MTEKLSVKDEDVANTEFHLSAFPSLAGALASVETGRPTMVVSSSKIRHAAKAKKPKINKSSSQVKNRIVKSSLKKVNQSNTSGLVRSASTLGEIKDMHISFIKKASIPESNGKINGLNVVSNLDHTNTKLLPEGHSIIENISGKSCDADDEEIDVENDSEEESSLPSCPTQDSDSESQDSIYQHLLQSANIVKEDVAAPDPVVDSEPFKSDQSRLDRHDEVTTKCPDDNFDIPHHCNPDKNLAVPTASVNESDNEVKIKTEVVSETTSAGLYLPDYVMCTPQEEKILPLDSVTEEERNVHKEFFDGRPPKTPERYLKIRNYIVECWMKSKPVYLNKTKIRSGLKNCGDVNCIGRIHAYLEWTGAINFGCEQTVYNNPVRVSNPGKQKQKKETMVNGCKTNSLVPRKRRIKDEHGAWVDPIELEGKTIPHEVHNKTESKITKPRIKKIQYDPFKLVPCKEFSDKFQAPYKVSIASTALAVMDIHSHISKTEVIGMLGGHFDPGTQRLTIRMAVPCKSLSTGMQCEMDPGKT